METLISVNHLGDVDHTLVKAPYFKLTRKMEPQVCVYDIRLLQPNDGVYLSTSTMHSIEHMLAVVFSDLIPAQFVNLAPLGCRTGFYLTTTGIDPLMMGGLLKQAIQKALVFKYVPLANRYQCGNCRDHNLEGAKAILRKFLENSAGWAVVV